MTLAASAALPAAAAPPQSYKARGIQLILTNPSPRVVRLMERSGLIAKIGRDWIFVRVHDAVRRRSADDECDTLHLMPAGGGAPCCVHAAGQFLARPWLCEHVLQQQCTVHCWNPVDCFWARTELLTFQRV